MTLQHTRLSPCIGMAQVLWYCCIGAPLQGTFIVFLSETILKIQVFLFFEFHLLFRKSKFYNIIMRKYQSYC